MIDLEQILRDRIEELATALLGKPSERGNGVLRLNEILEFQGRPEINVVTVTIAGPRRGDWYGDIYAEGEDPLDFICAYAGCYSRDAAARWGELWLAGKLVPVPTCEYTA